MEELATQRVSNVLSFFLLMREKRKMPKEEDESLIIYLKRELEASLVRNDTLEIENHDLRQEVNRLKSQIASLKAHDHERKSLLWKKLQTSNANDTIKIEPIQHKSSDFVTPSHQSVADHPISSPITPQPPPLKDRQLPNPPPPPPPGSGHLKENFQNKLPLKSAPPPPPLPSKAFIVSKPVRRVPEVAEFYRLLTRKNVNMENKGNSMAFPATAFTPNMIGEIENRSSHLSAIKSDVEKRKEFISSLINEVESAAFKDITEVERFVKWLDNELNSLVDERAVLKHFPRWPERKADALREAAFNYRDMRNLDSEVSTFEDNPKEPLAKALGKMQALQDRLESSVNSAERSRESTMKKYRDFEIPWQWLQDNGLIGQMKVNSLRIAKEYMRRITKELQLNECTGEENIMLQGARFAYRVHQFAGGFDTDSINAFKELRRVALSRHKQ